MSPNREQIFLLPPDELTLRSRPQNKSTDPSAFVLQPEPITPKNVQIQENTKIRPEYEGLGGGISYDLGETYWGNICNRLLDQKVIKMRLDNVGTEEKRQKLKDKLGETYNKILEFIEKTKPNHGAEYYRQKLYQYKNSRDVRGLCQLGVMALEESEKLDDKARKEFQMLGFIILQQANLSDVADPLPAYCARMECLEKGGQNLKIKKDKKTEEIKETSNVLFQHKEGMQEFSLPHYAERLGFWTNRYIERFGSDLAPQEVEFSKRFRKDLKAAGGTKEMTKIKKHPTYFEEMIRHDENYDYSAHTLYFAALEALYNPLKRYEHRSEKAGVRLLELAHQKASDDSYETINSKGYYEYVFKKVYLYKKGKTEPKGHAMRKEIVAMIGREHARRKQ